MKILCYIHSLRAGGAERVLSTLANYWVESGHSVHIVTLQSEKKDFYALDPRITREVLFGAPGDEPTRIGLHGTLQRILRLRYALRTHQPDIALSMMDTANVVMALAGVGLRKTRRIGSERVYPIFGGIGVHWRILRKIAYRLLSGVVVLTAENAAWLHKHTLVRRTWVIPNPVSLPLESGAPVVAPPVRGEGRFLLLAVGRLARQKGFDILLRAFAASSSSFGAWDLRIVGEGPERENLQSMIDRLGISDRVGLVGAAGNIADWYKRADIFVLSSRYEGFPNTLLEALAHGVPVVAADCLTGPKDLVREGVDGLLTVPENVGALASAMNRLMADAQLRSEFASRAVEVNERFSIERVGGMWKEVMEDDVI